MGAVVFFAFILFVMGGVTAYMGDRLGSYIGKKRHSTFGLRPRHTAMLWTVVSGGVIAVGTLLLFLALNQTFSTALVRGPQLLETNSLLDRENRTLTKHNFATERQAQADNRRAGEAQAQAAQAQASLSKVASALGLAQSNLAQSRNTLAQRQAALMGAENQLLAARGNLTGTQEQLVRAQNQVRTARLGVRDAQKQLQIASSQVGRAYKNVLALGIKQDSLLAANRTLANENKTLVATSEALVRRNQIQQSLLLASQGHSLIFRHEEELGRTVVSASQSPDALRRELAVFLDQVELTARQRGAGGLDNSPAVVIAAPGEGRGQQRGSARHRPGRPLGEHRRPGRRLAQRRRGR